jgi:hypothetical protein
MRRRVFSLASLVSLLLCVATVVLWVRTLQWNTFVAYDATITARGVQWQYYVDTYEGTVHFARLMNADRTSQLPGGKFRFLTFRITSRSSLTGARYWVATGAGYWRQHLTLPCWMIGVACAVLPGLRLIQQIRNARRASVGTCGHCSYDLTGNTSGICPECGTAVKGPN